MDIVLSMFLSSEITDNNTIVFNFLQQLFCNKKVCVKSNFDGVVTKQPNKTKMHQSLTGHLMHFIYLTVFSNYGRWYTTNLNFPFSIFNFQFSIRSGDFILAFIKLSSRTGNGDSPLFKCFHTLLECFDYIPCFIVCES